MIAAEPRLETVVGELRKLPAFLRRDFLTAWSYRMSFVVDWITLALQAMLFYLVGLMVDPSKLPSFGGTRSTYMEFAAVGIALGAFLAIALARVSFGIRNEQLMGTLESLLMTPTALSTIQVGSVIYDMVYVPIRTGIFLLVITFAFGLHFRAEGILPALAFLLLFIPFAWGLGVLTAGAVLTFRRGGGIIGFITAGMVLAAGAYIPLSLLPHWIVATADYNPMAIAIRGMRAELLVGVPWSVAAPKLAILAAVSTICFMVGTILFRAAVQRERRRGTLGLY